LELPAFSAINPAARQWLDTVANVRIHGETRCKPLERFVQEKPLLKPLPLWPYDCAVLRATGANGCCRVVFDTNRYTVPYLYASQKLTLKIYPDQLLLYHHEKLIATHLRCYDRRQNIQNPDHIKELLEQRHKAREQTCLQTFLNLGAPAEAYGRQLYGQDKVARALEDALAFDAYGCEYIANLLEQRERHTAVPSPLHLTRRQDLLDLELPAADLNLYDIKPQPPQS